MNFQLFLFLFLSILSSSAEDICYVKPANSSQVCPGDPCLTLGQYANETAMYFTTGSVFVFIQGNHTLDEPLCIEHVSNVTMKRLNINDIVSILCIRNSGIEGYNITNMFIEGLEFVILFDRRIISGTLLVFNASGGIMISNSQFRSKVIESGISIRKRALHFDFCDTIAIINCRFEGIGARKGGAILALNRTNLTLARNTFIGNIAEEGGAINVHDQTVLILAENTFIRNRAEHSGGAINADNETQLVLAGNNFIGNGAENYGGAIFAYNRSHSVLTGNTFTANFARSLFGGAIYAFRSSVTLRGIQNDSFSQNIARFAGAIYTQHETLKILNSARFFNNRATLGGAISVTNSSILINGSDVIFMNNTAAELGGGIFAHGEPNDKSINITLNSVNFTNNYARLGGAISLDRTSATLKNIKMSNYRRGIFTIYNSTVSFEGTTTFSRNSYHGQQVEFLLISDSKLIFNGNTIIEYNHGRVISALKSVLVFNGLTEVMNNIGGVSVIILSTNSSFIFIGNTMFRNNNILYNGGGLYVFGGQMLFTGTTTFHNNSAGQNAGALFVFHSAITFNGMTLFCNNSAALSGGVIVSQYGTISFQGHTMFNGNIANEGGGVFYSLGTTITLQGTVDFSFNTAKRGGAMYFLGRASLILNSRTNLNMSYNRAIEYGGAIFHEDIVTRVHCLNVITSIETNFLDYCFLDLKDPTENSETIMNSHYNSAGSDGNFLYGGLLDNSRLLNIPMTTPYEILSKRILRITSQDKGNNDITSKPYLLCYCGDDQYECNEIESNATIYRGQNISISVRALGQGNSIIPADVVGLTSDNSRIKVHQNYQHVSGNCSKLTYTFFSRNDSANITFYPDGPCHGAKRSYKIIRVTFLPCPDAFKLEDDHCICEERLQAYDAECVIGEENRILKRNGSKFWMSFLREDDTYQGLVLYPSCPPDYCTTENPAIPLDNPDIQCARNRSGVLCGQCATNHSLLLGSSGCARCSNNYIALVVAFAAAGFFLVVYLAFFRMTVANGMMNSLILYANIVQVNRRLFFPTDEVNVLTIFIAWLNLDFGFQTCFYDGLDAYVQTWLQFAFPLYVWLLIIAIIMASRYSITISKLIGTNPIAVLATLILMSYTKVLQVVIGVFSSVNLDYPQRRKVRVWLKDANVDYLRSKHLFLAVVTLMVVTFFFLPYTVFLLLGPQIYRIASRKFVRRFVIVRRFVQQLLLRIKPLLDSYYAPYKRKTRYWTGFLLLIRCILYIIFAYNSLGDTNRSLLAIIITFTGVGGIAWISGRVYRNNFVEIMEFLMYLNLISLSAATLTGINERVPVNILVGMVFASMIIITLYQFYQLYISKNKVWLKIKTKVSDCLSCLRKKDKPSEEVKVPRPAPAQQERFVTQTVIDLREPVMED